MSYYNHKLAYISVAIIVFLTILYFINAISISGDSLIVNFNLKIIHTGNLTTFSFLLVLTGIIGILYVVYAIIRRD